MANKAVNISFEAPDKYFDEWVEIFVMKNGWLKYVIEDGQEISNPIRAVDYLADVLNNVVWGAVKEKLVEKAAEDARKNTALAVDRLISGEE